MALNYQRIIAQLEPVSSLLKTHSLYNKVDSIPKLKIFMKSHVYAVWDFMSILKSLQNDLTVTSVPWIPPTNINAARFINEIVISEESDEVEFSPSKYISHYGLYLYAMKEVNAFCEPVESLVADITKKTPWEIALQNNKTRYSNIIPKGTLKVSTSAKLHQKMAHFFFGREDPIPVMFQNILTEIENKNIKAKMFKAYLDRHIQLDGDDHGPLSIKILESICEENTQLWDEVYESAIETIEARIKLWDSIENQLNKELTIYEVIGGIKTLENFVHHWVSQEKETINHEIVKENTDVICEVISEALGGPKARLDGRIIIKKLNLDNLTTQILKFLNENYKGFGNNETVVVKNAINRQFERLI